MTQSFKLNCSVSADKDKTAQRCGGKKERCSKHNIGESVVAFQGRLAN